MSAVFREKSQRAAKRGGGRKKKRTRKKRKTRKGVRPTRLTLFRGKVTVGVAPPVKARVGVLLQNVLLDLRVEHDNVVGLGVAVVARVHGCGRAACESC